MFTIKMTLRQQARKIIPSARLSRDERSGRDCVEQMWHSSAAWINLLYYLNKFT